MANGLSLTLREFSSLPQKQQMNCLYENQVKTLSLIKTYKFSQKLQWAWLTAVTGAAIFLIKQIITLK